MDWKKKQYWLVLCLLSSVAFYGHVLRFQKVEVNNIPDFSEVPLEIGDWKGQDFTFGEDVLDVLKANRTFFRRYVNSSGTEVWLFIGYWADQKYGAQPHSPLHCLPGSGWNIVSNKLIPLAGGTSGNGTASDARANFAMIGNDDSRKAMLYWYQTRSGYLPKELSVKLDLARNALMRKPTDAAFIRLTSPAANGSAEMQLQVLQQFWRTIQPHVQTVLSFNS